MIYFNHYQIPEETINKVISLYQEESNINIVKEELNLDTYLILHILLSFHIITNEEALLSSLKVNLNDSKIMLISDTHYGSALENPDYINQVFDYCLNHDIKTVLHAGDFIQGNKKPLPRDFRSTYYQALMAIKDYPSISSITTYLLLGNHDVYAINKNSEVLDILQSRDDIKVLGPKKVYLKWQDNVISMSHKIDHFHLLIPNIQTLIEFAGHRHRLVVEKSKVYLPTLSDDCKGNVVESSPGFIVATISSDELFLEYHQINEKIENKGLILNKKIGEKNEWHNPHK